MARRRGGLRGRLDQLQANANSTMFSAQDLIAFAKAVLADVEDGVKARIEFVRVGEGTIIDFCNGTIDRLPVGIEVQGYIREEDEPEQSQ